MSLLIESGDIFACRSNTWLSDAIDDVTGHGGFSHIAICSKGDPGVRVTEALQHVVVTKLEDLLARETHVRLLKPPLTPEQRLAAVNTLAKMLGRAYNYPDILLQLADSVAGTRWFTEHWTDWKKDGPICSLLGILADPSIGLVTEDATPNDIVGLAQVQRWPQEDLQ